VDQKYIKALLWFGTGFQFDYVFDWTILKYQQSQSMGGPQRVSVGLLWTFRLFMQEINGHCSSSPFVLSLWLNILLSILDSNQIICSKFLSLFLVSESPDNPLMQLSNWSFCPELLSACSWRDKQWSWGCGWPCFRSVLWFIQFGHELCTCNNKDPIGSQELSHSEPLNSNCRCIGVKGDLRLSYVSYPVATDSRSWSICSQMICYGAKCRDMALWINQNNFAGPQNFRDPHRTTEPADAARRRLAPGVVASGGVKPSEAPKLKSPGRDEATIKDLVGLQIKLLVRARMAL
jgi:hypothetical protein